MVRGEEILPFWDQKIDIGTGGPLGSKKIIKSYDFWTLVKPKLKITPVSETAGKIQSHGGIMVVVGGRRAEQTTDFVIKKMRVCAFLVRSSSIWFPKVTQILPKVAPNP